MAHDKRVDSSPLEERSASPAGQEQVGEQEEHGPEQPWALPAWMQGLFKVPKLGPLEFAEPSDVMRLGVVSYVGFAKTSEYKWIHPWHTNSPVDAINWERFQAQLAIDDSRGMSPKYVCMVIRDVHDPDEMTKSGIFLPISEATSEGVVEDDRIVVGLAFWTLQESVMYGRRLRCESEAECPCFPRARSDVKNSEHEEALHDKVAHLLEEHISGCGMVLKRLVVHPAYHNKGHGKMLVEWGKDLANCAGIKIGVDAAASASDFYAKLGFKTVAQYCMDGDEISPGGIAGSIMKYAPVKAEEFETVPEAVEE